MTLYTPQDHPRQLEIDKLWAEVAMYENQINSIKKKILNTKCEIAKIYCPFREGLTYQYTSTMGTRFEGVITKISYSNKFPFYHMRTTIFRANNDGSYLLYSKDSEIKKEWYLTSIDSSLDHSKSRVFQVYTEYKEKGLVPNYDTE